jgi:Polysaccharide lyase
VLAHSGRFKRRVARDDAVRPYGLEKPIQRVSSDSRWVWAHKIARVLAGGDHELAVTGTPPVRGVSERAGGRLVRLVAATAIVAAVATPGSASQPAPSPYWIGDFRNGNFCQFATVFQSTSVNPGMSSSGYLQACPQYTLYAKDPSQRVHLTTRPRPPARAASRWASHQELRTTDGPWYAGNSTDKATIRLTSEQTLNGAFRMSSVRWFRFSFYLPNPGFNWPADDWYNLMDLHNDVDDPAARNWPSIQLIVTPTEGKRRYLALSLDGTRARSNYEEVRLLQLTRRDGSRIFPLRGHPGRRKRTRARSPFNRWHTLILGLRFSDQGRIGDSPGWVQIYLDGKRVYSKARPNVWANETSVWLQLQNYKDHDAAFVDGATSSIIHFADARAGYTLAAVS